MAVKFSVGGSGVQARKGPWPKTKRGALNDSIRKWEFLVENRAYNGTDTCALCYRYVEGVEYEKKCKGCPVMAKTGKAGCLGTPWRAYPTKAQAKRELAFLRSLKAPA